MTDTPTAGRFEGREHRLPVRVYYEDTDFTGLVYHANYVRHFERGRSDCLRLMGIGHAELLDGDKPMAFVVSKMALHFLKPARIDDQLVVRTHYDAVKPGRGGGGLNQFGGGAARADAGPPRQDRTMAGARSLTISPACRVQTGDAAATPR